MSNDLFGMPLMPKITDQGFEEFWEAYPKCSRKGEKSACKEKWAENYYFYQSTIILKHLDWMKSTPSWLKDNGMYIPAPKVYLNQQRWDGADIPDLVVKPDRDPELTRLEEETKKAVPMPKEVRLRLAQLRGRN
jgi:hypothetical protein